MKAEMTSQLVTDALMMTIWRRGKPAALLHHSDRGSQGGFNRSLQYQQLKVVMAAYTRGSDRCNRKKLCSSGRPSAWRRENHRRFWQAIAQGRTSEEAAVEAGVSTSLDHRLYQTA
jgi:hypothetical protein